MNAATLPLRPSPMSAAAWSAATGRRSTVEVGAGAAAMVTSQAAEKVYRSHRRRLPRDTRLAVGAGGWLEWCPQETILFDRCPPAPLAASWTSPPARGPCSARRSCSAASPRASATEPRPPARPDRRPPRRPRSSGRRALRLDGDYAGAARGRAPAWRGARGAARPSSMPRPTRRSCLDAGPRLPCRQTASGPAPPSVDGLLVGRFLAEDPLALRRAFTLFWTRLPRRRGRPAAASCRGSGMSEETPCT